MNRRSYQSVKFSDGGCLEGPQHNVNHFVGRYTWRKICSPNQQQQHFEVFGFVVFRQLFSSNEMDIIIRDFEDGDARRPRW